MIKGLNVQFAQIGERGQLVIPKELRDELKIETGSMLELVSADNLILMKKIEPQVSKEDLIALKKIDSAWKEIESGEYKTFSKEDFKKKLLAGEL